MRANPSPQRGLRARSAVGFNRWTSFVAGLLCLVLSALPARATWQQDLDALLKAPPGRDRDQMVRQVAAEAPDWRAVADRLRAITFPDVEKGKPLVRSSAPKDGISRPYVIYVPASYDPKHPTPLAVYLHGGVMQESVSPDPKAVAAAEPFTRLCESKGWLCLYPLGDKDTAWWSADGMANVRNEVRAVKRDFNVDDDRVWLAGFSDGGTAAYLQAMVDANDYAAFVALNGHVSGGSFLGRIETYLPNLANSPVLAVATTHDEMFPASQTMTVLDALSGAPVTLKTLEGHHDLEYWDSVSGEVAAFLEAHPRKAHPARITWEASDPHFGRFRWLSISKVDGPSAAWHTDVNPVVTDNRVRYGFIPDTSYTEGGIPIKDVLPDTPAAEAGIRAGDILLKVGDADVHDMAALRAFRDKLVPGQTVTMRLRREGKERTVNVHLPEATTYRAFQHEKPSAMARATFTDNHIEIQGSRLGAFRVLLDPDLFALDQPLQVRVDGVTVYNAKGEPDTGFLLRDFLENRDRRLLYVAALDLKP